MKLHALVGTQSEFDHSEKGDALYAFELALCAPTGLAVPGPQAALGWVIISSAQHGGWGGGPRRCFPACGGAASALDEV